MKTKALILLFSAICLQFATFAQQLTLDLLKNSLNYTDEEFAQQLSAKNFKLIEKDHKNMGDKLINKTEYYSNRTESNTIDGNAETAIFYSGKRSKKSLFISFSQSMAFGNFNALEDEIKKQLKKEGVFQSEKYDSSILKYSSDKTLFYLFKEEDTYYIIVSNYPFEDVYFNNKPQ